MYYFWICYSSCITLVKEVFPSTWLIACLIVAWSFIQPLVCVVWSHLSQETARFLVRKILDCVFKNLLFCIRLTFEGHTLWSPVSPSLFKGGLSSYFGLVSSYWCPRRKRSCLQSSARSLKTLPWLSRAKSHSLGNLGLLTYDIIQKWKGPEPPSPRYQLRIRN